MQLAIFCNLPLNIHIVKYYHIMEVFVQKIKTLGSKLKVLKLMYLLKCLSEYKFKVK
jgi:hypothetical protein